MALTKVIQRVLALFDDLDQTWLDKDFIVTHIGIVNEDLENLLEDLDLSYDTDVQVLLAVPANTTDLSAYQADGQQLADMMFPAALEYRLQGETNEDWKPVGRVDAVLDTDMSTAGEAVASDTQGIASWEWRKGIIYISPSSVIVDIRVRLEDLPACLDSDSATYIKGMTNVIAYWVCENICSTQGGNAFKARQPWFKQKFDEAFESISDRMVKEEQVTARRMGGRRSQLGGSIWRTPTA